MIKKMKNNGRITLLTKTTKLLVRTIANVLTTLLSYDK